MSSNEKSTTLRQLASLLGASGVGIGAFGAHALKATLAKKQGATASWTTAVSYQLLHAVALLGLSAIDTKSMQTSPSPGSWSGGKMMALGTAMFSGSIYLLCLDVGPKKLLGPITPMGGMLLISGWAMVGIGKI
mmetsp:Transcript_34128/g.72718  ORF Transcript_34128/g.72718 Transcript_34128/m.72718 type:complete len:134 (-) Transcript_34128:366-767(-)|eukprot:CAMPEP_0172550816 /NCGR_PEP_ID=MMETSP1067-20121228/33355_1 /TAXON_ID=265564 ORGANISM="Thalassiosira punctigera, Strain Tpunct2005C2" /NCGR_SAMPLE_ID=MMETSP1067 /ASSEMBLY_ACC=CAM_ASM_000444 /LENGTH=133 /DNA_ID=CAMNT_0013338485 /DNA_START=46 /DNA_END=447 /DNA_ORIENTATION=+